MAEELVSEDDGLLSDADPSEDEEVVEAADENEDPVDITDPDPDPEPKKRRGDTRIQALREREESERQGRVRAEEELQRIRGEQSRLDAERQRQQALAEENDEKIPYEQRIFKYTQRRDREMQERQQQLEARLLDTADRSEYAAKAQSNAVYARYKDKVEQRLNEMRAQGRGNAPREAILKFLIGEDALSGKTAKTSSKQKDEAAARVTKARGEPIGARSDARAGSGGKSKLKDLEKRLTDVPL